MSCSAAAREGQDAGQPEDLAGTGPVAVGDLVDDDPAAEAVLAARVLAVLLGVQALLSHLPPPRLAWPRHRATPAALGPRPGSGPLGGPACPVTRSASC